MSEILHLLKSAPDLNTIEIIEAMSGDEGVAVVSLYQDEISGRPINWQRLVDDIFRFKRVISWW